MSTAARKPWLSGFCSPGMDLASHRRCIEHPRADGVPCSCTQPDCPCSPFTGPVTHAAIYSVPPPAVTTMDPPGEPLMLTYPEVDPLGALTIDQAVDLYAAAASKLNEVAKGTLPGGTEGIRLLDRLRTATDEAKTVDSALVTRIYLTAEHGDQEVDGIGYVSVYRTKERKAWDVRGVVQAVIDKHMEERGGEMPNDPWDIAEWILEVLPGGDPRLTPLRNMKLKPENFHTVTPGNPSVRLPPR